jgi:hypothetical protein
VIAIVSTAAAMKGIDAALRNRLNFMIEGLVKQCFDLPGNLGNRQF